MNHSIYYLNNFIFYSRADELCEYFVRTLAQWVESLLSERINSWMIERIKAPMFISRDF